MSEEEDKGYRVEDRRFIFRKEQEEKAKAEAEKGEAGEAAAGVAEPEGGPEQPSAEGRPAGEPEAERRPPLPPITFATFVFSLNSSALIHLGEVADPTTGKTERNLDLAKQTVDLLGLLKEKTRGNLTEEEDDMLDAVLFDLRMRYVRLKG